MAQPRAYFRSRALAPARSAARLIVGSRQERRRFQQEDAGSPATARTRPVAGRGGPPKAPHFAFSQHKKSNSSRECAHRSSATAGSPRKRHMPPRGPPGGTGSMQRGEGSSPSGTCSLQMRSELMCGWHVNVPWAMSILAASNPGPARPVARARPQNLDRPRCGRVRPRLRAVAGGLAALPWGLAPGQPRTTDDQRRLFRIAPCRVADVADVLLIGVRARAHA